MSGRHSCLHELLPCQSIQSKSPCHCQAEIERAQIVLNRSRPGLQANWFLAAAEM